MSDRKTVVVVGGGMAGLAAAVEASRIGAKVVVIEGQKTTGGNSAKATSGINGCQTKAQNVLKIHDSHDLFFGDTLKAGHRENDVDLVDVLVHNAANAIQFLDDLGMDLSEVSIGGGHSVPRTHAFPMPPDGKLKPFGATVMRTVFTKLQSTESDSIPNVEFIFETKVISLITSDDNSNRVTGVRTKSSSHDEIREIRADAVILATGGFCSDHDPETSLLKKYAGENIKYPTTNGPFADGSGMKMAEKVGAQLVDMDKIQIHPTGFIDPNNPKASTKFLAAEALRGSGGILLNEKGQRFANELGLRDYLTSEILKHCALNETTGTHTAYLILNQEAVDKFSRPAFEFYWKIKKFFNVADNMNQLAQMLSISLETLRKTISDYNNAKIAVSDPFGKKVFPVSFKPGEKLYVGSITPVLHYSMGGVKINGRAQVLRKSDSKTPIEGLYAAGEVAGGIHGGNRLSGNSYLDCVVFGRIAGINAATVEQV
uniref:fumarate reductase (NADH) n=1 Tax=Romanomermis culicivorax TaxID=13658 RepID=A0A915ISI2_ROMCU